MASITIPSNNNSMSKNSECFKNKNIRVLHLSSAHNLVSQSSPRVMKSPLFHKPTTSKTSEIRCKGLRTR